MAKKIILASSGLGCLVCIGLIIFALAATAVTIDPAQLESAKQNIISLIDSGKYAEASAAVDKMIADFNKGLSLPDALYAVAEALDFQNWPKTDVRRVAPSVDKSMLAHPELVNSENKSYDTVWFAQECWGAFRWWADHMVETNTPLPTELPEERKKNLLRGIAPELRNKPELVNKYLEETLERHRASLKYRPAGSLMLDICNTPSPRSAHEYLLSHMVSTSMMPQGIISNRLMADKPNDLGTMSYVMKDRSGTPNMVEFIRDNIVVVIRGEGEFANEIVELARKIDAAIVNSPALTYEQLVARRPSLSIAGTSEKGKNFQQMNVPFSVALPPDVNVVYTKATVGGRTYGAADGRITLNEIAGPATIKLLAITDELLVGQAERTVNIPPWDEKSQDQ